mgnify:CR=1 FL=1
MNTKEERLKAVDEGIAKARKALEATDDNHLMKTWRLKVAGNVVSEQPRHVVLRDTFNHMAHHRGQLTVYLRMMRGDGAGALRAFRGRESFRLDPVGGR